MDNDSLFILIRNLIRYRPRSRSDEGGTRSSGVPSGRSIRRLRATDSTKGTSMKMWARVMRFKDNGVDAWCERKGIKKAALAA